MDWPTQLQQYLDSSTFTYNYGEVAIESQNATGIRKKRRRFTNSVDTISGSILLHKDHWDTLYNFYYSSVGGGVDFFSIPHPITGDPVDVRFSAPPSVSAKGGEYFKVALEWELRP